MAIIPEDFLKNLKYFEKFGKIMPSPIIFVGKEKKFEAIHLQPGQTHKIKLPLKYNKFGITHHVSFGHSFMQRAIHKLHSQHFGVFSTIYKVFAQTAKLSFFFRFKKTRKHQASPGCSRLRYSVPILGY